MVRVRRIVGTFAPLMMVGVGACGGNERSFVDNNGNPMDAATMRDVVVVDNVTTPPDAEPDAGDDPDAGSDPDDADANTADVTVDATPDVSNDGRTDATLDRAGDSPAAPDGRPDGTLDTGDAVTGDNAFSDAPLDVYADVTTEPEAAPPPCSPVGGYRCSDIYLQQCTATGWADRMRCATPALCDALGGVCTTPVCQPNSYRCTGPTLQICNADQNGWIDKEACASAALCDATGGKCGTSACTPGTYQCSGAVLQQCRNDATGWNDVSTCATSGLCYAAGGICNPPACAVGQYQCSGAQLQQCNADRSGFTTVSNCATSALCNAAGGTCNAPACAVNQYQCVGSTLQVCNAAQTGWATAQVCYSQALCDAPGKTCKSGCTNLAPLATSYSSGGGTTANQIGPEGMNDGILGCMPAGGGGGWHWISNGTVAGGTAYVQYNWGIAQTIAMIHIDTANQATGCSYAGTVNISPGRTFKGAVVQYWTGAAWGTVGTISAQSNDFDYVFPTGPLNTIAIRLYDVYSATLGNTPVLEWQVYAATGCASPIDP
jgi:hypothetical protein